MKTLALALLLLGPISAAAPVEDLAAARAEPDPERRSDKFLQVADASFKFARKAAKEGDVAAEKAALENIREAVALAIQSLRESGKNARQNPKHFKIAELELRKLMRGLDDFRYAKSADQRPETDDLGAALREAHDEVLMGIMTKKPKN